MLPFRGTTSAAIFNAILNTAPTASIRYVKKDKDKETNTLCRVSVLGGESTKLIENIDSPVTLSPDGKQLAFVRHDEGQEESALIIANDDGSSQKKLAARKYSELYFVDNPAWSPDGKVIVVGTIVPNRRGRQKPKTPDGR